MRVRRAENSVVNRHVLHACDFVRSVRDAMVLHLRKFMRVLGPKRFVMCSVGGKTTDAVVKVSPPLPGWGTSCLHFIQRREG